MNGENLTEFAEKYKSAVVLIKTFNKKGEPFKEVAGFFVNNKGEIITDKTGIQYAYSAVTKTVYGDEYPVKGIVGIKMSWCLAKIIVDTKGKKTPFLKLCTTLPHKGEPVLVISNPLNPEGTVLEGIISDMTEPSPDKAIEIKAIGSRWLEGSPVLNLDGQVIAMAAFYWWPIEDATNFCVPSKKIIHIKRRKMQTLSEWTEEEIAKCASRLAKNPYHVGFLKMKNEGYLSALNYFKESARKRPRERLLNNVFLAECYFNLGYYHEAIKAYVKSGLTRLPDVQFNIGWAYFSLNQYKEAIEAYKKAIHLKPDWAAAYFCLGMAYIETDNWVEAFNQHMILKHLDPNLADEFSKLLKTYYSMDVCLGNA